MTSTLGTLIVLRLFGIEPGWRRRQNLFVNQRSIVRRFMQADDQPTLRHQIYSVIVIVAYPKVKLSGVPAIDLPAAGAIENDELSESISSIHSCLARGDEFL